MQRFYLGTHQPSWVTHAGVPLFISHRRLAQRKTLPRAAAEWARDSGAYTELLMFGQWSTSAADYVAAVRRYDDEIGELNWAAPQDMTCEVEVLCRTGLGVRDHQRRTVENFVELQMLWADPLSSPFLPVIQGMTVSDYRRCVDIYSTAGVELAGFPLVGIGSVCRRQGTADVDAIISAMLRRDPGLPMHVFGTKSPGLARYGHKLVSADTCVVIPGQTVAAAARPPAPVLLELDFALQWRRRVLAATPAWQLPGLGKAA